MHYRRANEPGATYFFTVNLADRKTNLLVDAVDLLRISVRYVKADHPFTTNAMVIMPDHIHALWTLPEGDSDFSTRWCLIKAGFSRQIAPTERVSASRRAKGERGIWQRRFWEHLIRDDRDYERHVDYIHFRVYPDLPTVFLPIWAIFSPCSEGGFASLYSSFFLCFSIK